MPKTSRQKISQKFEAGQKWSREWHYDWASFGEQPTQYETIHIVRRTPHMIIYHFGDPDVSYRSKVKTFTGQTSEYFATGFGTATRVYNTMHMKLLK